MTELADQTLDFAHYLTVEQGLAKNSVTSYTQELHNFAAYLTEQQLTSFLKVDRLTVMNYLSALTASGKSKKKNSKLSRVLQPQPQLMHLQRPILPLPCLRRPRP